MSPKRVIRKRSISRRSRVQNDTERAIFRFIKLPVIILIGILVVGIIIEGELGIKNAVKYLFISIGGIGLFGYFFRNEIRKWMRRK